MLNMCSNGNGDLPWSTPLTPHNLHYVQHLWAFNKNCQMHGQSFVSTITHDE